MTNWDAQEVLLKTIRRRDIKIKEEQKTVQDYIDRAASDGFFECTLNLEFTETIKWLRDLKFKTQHTNGAVKISWAPENTDNWINNPYA